MLLNRFLPGGRGLVHKDELVLSPKQVNEMLSVAEEVLSLSGRYGNLGTEVAACAIKDADRYKQLNFGYKCGAAKNFFVIDPSGHVRTCNHSPRIVGHIFHNPIIDDMEYWQMFTEEEYKPSVCEGCRLLKECDCGCREVANILHGNPKGIDTTIVKSVNPPC